MTPTLAGRIQTRIFLVLVIGIPWTLLIGPALPRPEGATLGDLYEVLLTAVVVVAVFGIAWELLYQWLQQYRWEKDWPTLFGLITGVPEAISTYLILLAFGFDVDTGAFLIQFTTLWILVWLVANGPMRVVFPRWRFRGGRLL
jgi:hypothetical protein